MNNFILLGLVLGIIDIIYITLISYLVFNEKVSTESINKSMIGYFAIMATSLISMIIGIFVK